MATKYKKLLSPFRLTETVTLRNKLVSGSGQQACTQGPELFPSDNTIDEAISVATAGAGILCFTYYGIYGGGAAMGDQSHIPWEQERAHFQNYDFSNPKILNLYTHCAELTHMYGSKAIMRLGASGPAWPRGKSYRGGDRGDFVVPDERIRKFGKPMTFPLPPRVDSDDWRDKCASKEQIKAVIDGITEEARKLKSCGFDGMSFRADRYLDESTNIRQDEYGGDVVNRGRFLLELFENVKRVVGEDFLIEVNLMANSDHGHDGELPHGYTAEEARKFLLAVEHTVDYVVLREELSSGYQPLVYNSKPGVHPVLEYAQALKDAGFQKPVAVNGGFTQADDMEAVLDTGACDLIATSRAFLSDPLFIKKITSDDAEPTPCLRCNKCHHHIEGLWITGCSVNPRASISHRLIGELKKPIKKKKVAIIGGGPIGMRTACYAAENGHDVTIFEKTGYLGGKLKHADLYSFKWTFKQYREWLIGEVNRLGVKVELNTEPTPEEIEAAGFDAVIACTGSVAKRPPVDGADAEGVWTSEDVYEQRAKLGQKVVVVGGQEVATETAMYLADIGKDVTVITRADTLMKREARAGGLHNVHEVHFPDLGYGILVPIWCLYDNLNPVFEAQTTKITPNSVTYVTKDGDEVTIDCDSVVVNGGYQSCIESAISYGTCTREFYMAGDVEADKKGCLQQGNLAALGVANML
ncbi:MAG: FAD-dependent oxidoreductase [Oscillospiraceae bacterium]|nr:FAD-dependent oxidoreductase [Oscillospiraceae bacterium]